MKKKIVFQLLSLAICFTNCFAASFTIHSCISDVSSIQSVEIRAIELENRVNYLSAYFTTELENPTFYDASYFYNIQYVSKYWNFDGPNSNNIFFKYHEKGDYLPLQVKTDFEDLNVDLFCNLYEDACKMFPLTLEYGNQIKEEINSYCCEYSYISKALADSLGITRDNYQTKEIKIHTKRRLNSGTIKESDFSGKIAGVISNNSLGIYDGYVTNQMFMFTNWSEDIQVSMCNPDFNVIFSKDQTKNKYYINSFQKFTSKKLSLVYEDKINSKVSGSINDRMNNVKNKSNLAKTRNLIISVALLSFSFLIDFLCIWFFFKKTNHVFYNYFIKHFLISLILSFVFSLLTIDIFLGFFVDSMFIVLNETSVTLSLLLLILVITLYLLFEDKLAKAGQKPNEKV